MLLVLILLPLLGVINICFLPKSKGFLVKNVALLWSLFILLFSIIVLGFFDCSCTQFQFCLTFSWFSFYKNSFVFGLDGFSLLLVLLTSFLTPICILLSWNHSIEKDLKLYILSFLFLEFFLFIVFSSLDLLLFYIAFEAVLIPMFLIVGFYGSRNRRVRASYMLFLYTLISSLFTFLAILYLFFASGTTDFQLLKTFVMDPFLEKLCWLAFFFSFAVKMPLIPFHIWLPEAHCEAPTAGSVILAGVLLKLGGFGFIRYSIGLFPDSSFFFSPFVYTISIFGVIYASITTLQQVDLKKVIAYSSVGHMGLVTIGIFSANSQGIIGSAFLMISHGIVSGALFLCVGFLYERYNTRIIRYYSGLVYTMPLFSTFFAFFTLANLGLPGTSSFVGELLVLIGCFETNVCAALLSGFGMILGAAYSLWLFNRIVFGNIKTGKMFLRDLTRLEFFILLPFIFLTLYLGFFPTTICLFLTFF